MGLIEQKQRLYYEGRNFGNYQFTSLDDIINSFMVIHVGEDKMISKVKRTDVAFHAQRAMQELSFDTFRSCKTQEIVLPSSLTMVLPQDYVNYVKLTWSDDSGIEHLMYPTSKTSNPFKIKQDDQGKYVFTPGGEFALNLDFSDGDKGLENWIVQGNCDVANNLIGSGRATQSHRSAGGHGNVPAFAIQDRHKFEDTITAADGVLTFNHHNSTFGVSYFSNIHCVYQELDVDGITLLNLTAQGSTAEELVRTDVLSTSQIYEVHDGGVLRIGLTTTQPDTSVKGNDLGQNISQNKLESLFNIGYLEWNNEPTASYKQLIDLDSLDVSSYSTVYLVIVSYVPFKNFPENDTGQLNTIDNITIEADASVGMLQTSADGNSTTWGGYKANEPSANNINDYQDYQNHGYWPNTGERYGLDPQHSQVNGSFFIDCLRGKINFSSNIAGKNVILEYISDGLGTDKEMQVHKFAEEAMYKWIIYAVLASKRNIPEYVIARLKKEKFAETRKAKLRLSNIKLEEITQIFRGKSKQIKH